MAAIHIEQLRSSVRRGIVQPGDEAYESARMVYNRMIDKRPALVVRSVDVADVIAAVDYARAVFSRPLPSTTPPSLLVEKSASTH